MKRSRQSIIFFAILAITFLGVAFYAYENWHRVVRPLPFDQWKHVEPVNYWFDANSLKQFGFAKVNLDHVPLTDALKVLVDRVNKESGTLEKWSFKVSDPKLIEQHITLNLSNVQPFWVLNSITELAGAKFYLTEDRVIEVLPIDHVHPRELEIVESDLVFLSDDHEIYERKPGSHDIKLELTRFIQKNIDAKFSFEDNDSASYYPKELRVRVVGSRKNIEHTSRSHEFYYFYPEQTLSEKFGDFFNQISNRFFGSSSAIMPAVPHTTSNDPFLTGCEAFQLIGDLIHTGKLPTESK